MQEDLWQRSRLNYRDEESGAIRADPQQDQHSWQGKKSLKKKEKNKKKVSARKKEKMGREMGKKCEE
jgi:hypothetical protein